MVNSLFSEFAQILRDMSDDELAAEVAHPRKLLIDKGYVNGKTIDVAYAPFDYLNREARIVIVGLTPGRQQMSNSLFAARRSLRQGKGEPSAAMDAKMYASFSGPMRSNLVAMLDEIGLSRALGLRSATSLWNGDSRRVHLTSVLRYPVFVDGANYSGAPSTISTPILRTHLMKWFAAEFAALPNAIFVPLGPKVADAVETLARQLGLSSERVLSGLPHPSGANAERISFFLGRKAREGLSSKVEPERLLRCRALLEAKVAALS